MLKSARVLIFYRETIRIEQRQVTRTATCSNREQVFENCIPSGKQAILPLAQLLYNYVRDGDQRIVYF